jgi:hypothetical protein
MSKRKMKELGLKINKPSTKVLRVANGELEISIGKVYVKIDEGVPVKFEVIDTPNRLILFGTQCLQNGKIDYRKEKVTLYYENQKIIIPIEYKKNEENDSSDSEIDEELNE